MFEGQLVRLRAYRTEDMEISLKLIEEEGLRDTLSMEVIFPYSTDAQKEYIENSMKKNDKNIYNFAIEDKRTKQYIGSCGINEYDMNKRIATIGLFISKDFQNKGYGTDALQVLCKFIFDELNAFKITLFYFDFNENARKLYDKIGFVQEGIYRKELFRYGKYHDVIHMGLFKEEFYKSK